MPAKFVRQVPLARSMAQNSLEGMKNPMDAADMKRFAFVTSTISGLKPGGEQAGSQL